MLFYVRWRDFVRPLIFAVESEVGESDGFVVRMRKARAEIPVIVAARNLKDAIVVALVAR